MLAPDVQEFDLPLKPVAKGRPRFSVNRGMVRTRTPEATANAEAELRFFLAQKRAQKYNRPTAVDLSARFILPRTKRLPITKKTHATMRPDLDNYLKLLCDAANGYLWDDDSQVVECLISKRYAEIDESPHIHITVRRVA